MNYCCYFIKAWFILAGTKLHSEIGILLSGLMFVVCWYFFAKKTIKKKNWRCFFKRHHQFKTAMGWAKRYERFKLLFTWEESPFCGLCSVSKKNQNFFLTCVCDGSVEKSHIIWNNPNLLFFCTEFFHQKKLNCVYIFEFQSFVIDKK